MNAREIGNYYNSYEDKYGYPLTYQLPMTKFQVIDLKTTYSPESAYRGMEDHYIKLNGECHPDFEAVYINKVGGPKVCRRVVYDNIDFSTPTRGQTVVKKTIPAYPEMPQTSNARKYDYIREARKYNWSGLPNKKGYSIY